MPYSPDEFYAHALASADAEGRLPVADMGGWDIFPYEPDSLRSKPLQPPVVPEPPRGGEGGNPCRRCADPERNVIWSDEHWVLVADEEPSGLPFVALLMPREHLDLGDLDDARAAELGVLIVRIERAVRALSGIGRVHVNKWGDGGAHLHVFFLARPEGLLQLRGSCVTLWSDMLPPVEPDVLAADLRTVAHALAAHGGRAHV
ncbi:MAG TPA: hypothetical protein VNA20_12155 [Frankiaceae bacterium]|nr:hypothetical protein [Frankiaceae bacterium]